MARRKMGRLGLEPVTCTTGCGWTIYSNVFRRIMKFLPITKHPPVSASAREAAFKNFQFTCIGPFKRSFFHFEGMIPKKNTPQCDCAFLDQPDMTYRYLRVKSHLKREI